MKLSCLFNNIAFTALQHWNWEYLRHHHHAQTSWAAVSTLDTMCAEDIYITAPKSCKDLTQHTQEKQNPHVNQQQADHGHKTQAVADLCTCTQV